MPRHTSGLAVRWNCTMQLKVRVPVASCIVIGLLELVVMKH